MDEERIEAMVDACVALIDALDAGDDLAALAAEHALASAEEGSEPDA